MLIIIKQMIITQNVISLIFSYMTLMELDSKIAKLNKEIREFLINKEAKLNSKRILKILFNNQSLLDYKQLKYLLQLCSSFDIWVNKFEKIDLFIFQMLTNDYYDKLNLLSFKFGFYQHLCIKKDELLLFLKHSNMKVIE